jgi:hypothetical protein
MTRTRPSRFLPIVLMLLLVIPVQADCPWTYVTCGACCVSLCVDYPSGAVWYRGEYPDVGCMGDPYACVWCTQGCAWCMSIYMVVTAVCDGQVVAYSNHVCCRDYDCCFA